MTLAWLDGHILEGSRAAVGVADRGFLLGDGLFETLLARGRSVFRLEAHLARLARGAERLAIPLPPGIESAVASLVEAGGLPESALRLTLTRGPGGEGLDPPDPPRPTLAISLRPPPAFPRAWYERGLSLRTSAHRLALRSLTLGLKTLGYLPNVLALAHAREAGADDALLLDERDRVAEASASNLLWVAPSGELRTPSLACGILPGITRAALLELARARGLAVAEGEWGLAELAAAREAFTTSSLRAVAPVTGLDGRPLGSGAVGELTRALMRDYQDLVRRETSGPGSEAIETHVVHRRVDRDDAGSGG